MDKSWSEWPTTLYVLRLGFDWHLKFFTQLNLNCGLSLNTIKTVGKALCDIFLRLYCICSVVFSKDQIDM